jgi:hypothetical protein
VRNTNCRGRLARSGTVAGSLWQLANMLTTQELQTWKRRKHIASQKTGLPFRRTSSLASGLGSDPDFSQFSKDFVHIDGPLAVYGTRRVRLECLYLATFKNNETLTWILHVTGNDRLGTTAILLNLIDMHMLSINTLRSGRGSFSIDSKSWIEPFCGDMQRTPICAITSMTCCPSCPPGPSTRSPF